MGSIKIIEHDSIWKEIKTAKLYRVFDFCQIDLVRDKCDGIIYQSLENNNLYASPLHTFLKRFKFNAYSDSRGSKFYRYYDPERDDYEDNDKT